MKHYLFLIALLVTSAATSWAAWQPSEGLFPSAPATEHAVVQIEKLRDAAISLPIATGLGALLALRPRRRGTPPRTAAVVQTQIILAIVGALVMLIVGASLARAFGIVGAASLIRYRAKIADPKDAGVMLSTLAIGLASGVGLHLLSAFAALFILASLWVIESFEPQAHKTFVLKVASKEAMKLQPIIEEILRRNRAEYELRATSAEEISYQVLLPLEKRTDRLSQAIRRLDESGGTAVEWDEKKNRKVS